MNETVHRIRCSFRKQFDHDPVSGRHMNDCFRVHCTGSSLSSTIRLLRFLFKRREKENRSLQCRERHSLHNELINSEYGIDAQQQDALPAVELFVLQGRNAQDGHDRQHQRDIHQQRGIDAHQSLLRRNLER